MRFRLEEGILEDLADFVLEDFERGRRTAYSSGKLLLEYLFCKVGAIDTEN